MPINPAARVGVQIKTGVFSSETFFDSAKIIIKTETLKKMCTLVMDPGVSRADREEVKGYFLGESEKFGALRKLAPGVADLQAKLPDIEYIAVSADFKAGGKFIKDSKALGLNLQAVLAEAKRAKVAQIQAEAGTIGVGVDPARAATGTVFDVGYQFGLANTLFKHIVYNLLPFSVGEMYEEDNIGHRSGAKEAVRKWIYRKKLLDLAAEFRGKILGFIGIKNIGKYEPEVGVLKQVYLRAGLTRTEKEEIFSSLGVALRGDRSAAAPGEMLKLTIENLDRTGYVKKFFKAFRETLQAGAGKHLPKLRAANVMKAGEDDLAALAIVLHAREVASSLGREVVALEHEIAALQELKRKSEESQAEIIREQIAALGRKLSAAKKEKDAAADAAKFSEEDVLEFLRGNRQKFATYRQVESYVKEIDDYLELEAREEKRLFTLQVAFDVLNGKGERS